MNEISEIDQDLVTLKGKACAQLTEPVKKTYKKDLQVSSFNLLKHVTMTKLTLIESK